MIDLPFEISSEFNTFLARHRTLRHSSVISGIKLAFCVFLRRWIITAGHCLAHNLTILVQLGSHQDGTFELTLPVSVEDQYVFPGFYENRKVYDVGKR